MIGKKNFIKVISLVSKKYLYYLEQYILGKISRI